MQSLYNLTTELRTIDQFLEESEDGALFERQSELTALIQEKADSVVYYVQSQEDYLDAIEKRLKELQELKKRQTKKIENFEKYVMACLDTLGAEKISGNMAKIEIKKPRKVVEVYDQNLLENEFLRVKTVIEPDKIALKDALESGKEIQGARLTNGERKINFKLGK